MMSEKMWVCPNCSVNVYEDNCHFCGRAEQTEPVPAEGPCPLCGAPAQTGCVLGADRNTLQWFDGPPELRKNLASAFWGGEKVGTAALGAGVYAEGIRCTTCRRIIIAY
jgi:hypothetical protein